MSIPVDRSSLRAEGHVSARVRSSSSVGSRGKLSVAAERLTDDVLVEILSRVPAKSLCRFNCVSKHWLSLVNNPDHRKKLSQTLAGFFYNSSTHVHITSVQGSRCHWIDTSLSFLPNHPRFQLLDCCNGLLLCRWYISAEGSEFRYVVCNPATEKWVVCNPAPERCAVPPRSGQIVEEEVCTALLGFDPTLSSHFHLFEFIHQGWSWHCLTEMEVYSSETGRWVHKKTGLSEEFGLINLRSAAVYLNGYLHFHTIRSQLGHCLVAVDKEGETWMHSAVPGASFSGFIQRSQGHLHYANFRRGEAGYVDWLVVYVLKDYDSTEWILKHIVETSCLFGEINVCLYTEFKWIAIHPDCNLIFFTVGKDNMDRRQVKEICNLNNSKPPYLPYVPLYSGLQPLDM